MLLHLLAALADGLERALLETRVVLLDVVARVGEVALDRIRELVRMRRNIGRRVTRVLDYLEQLAVAHVRPRRIERVLTRLQMKDPPSPSNGMWMTTR